MGGAGIEACQAGVGAAMGPFRDQAGEEKAALERADCGGNIGSIEVAIALDLVLVQAAQDADPRQQSGAPDWR